MPTVRQLLDSEIAATQAELTRIDQERAANLAKAQTKLAALQNASAVLTPELEAVIDGLVSVGIVTVKLG